MRAVCGLIRPLRKEFGWQNSSMVTCSAAAEVYTAYSCGKGREALGSMVSLLQDGALFAEVGIHDAGRLPPMVSLSALVEDSSHPWITNGGLAVKSLMRTLLQLLKARLRSLSWSERGYPGVFAKALVGGDACASLLQVMRADWELWQRLQQMPGPILRKFVQRSSMQHMVVQKVWGLVSRHDARECAFLGVDGLRARVDRGRVALLIHAGAVVLLISAGWMRQWVVLSAQRALTSDSEARPMPAYGWGWPSSSPWCHALAGILWPWSAMPRPDCLLCASIVLVWGRL